MIALELSVVTLIARCPKSFRTSGCPMNVAAPEGGPDVPSSVAAAAYPRETASAIKDTQIVPAKPPLPICSYFPFQCPFAGIQTSKLILESSLGLEVPATRQRPTGALVTPDTMSPARYNRASVIVVCGSDRPVRFEHIEAAAEGSICRAK